MNTKYKDIYSGIFVSLIGIIIYVASFNIQQLMATSRVGGDFLPKIIGGCLLFLGIMLILSGVREYRSVKNIGVKKEKNALTEGEKFTIVTTVLLLLYVVFLELLGFIISTTLYMFFQTIILCDKSQRKLLQFGIIAVLTSVSVYYLFVSAFNIMIPSGILG